MGPIQLLFVTFEDFHATGAIAEELAALSDAGTIRVVDARFLLRDDDGLVALRASELSDHERDDLRAAAGALMGLGAGYVLGGEEGAAEGASAGAALGAWVGDEALDDQDVEELGEDLEPGEAILLLVLELVWAEGLRDALRQAGATSVSAEFVTPEGLVALGALLGAAAAESD